jgi:hypothetical protein
LDMTKIAPFVTLFLMMLCQAVAAQPANGPTNYVLNTCAEAAKEHRAGDTVSATYMSDSSFCAGFMIASAQAYLNDMRIASNGTFSSSAQCLYNAVSGATPLQVTVIFVRYATANPQTWSLSAYSVAVQAINDAFSRLCPK